MKTSIRELRNSTKDILNTVQKGHEVIICSRHIPIAKIIPLSIVDSKKEDYGFGMWSDMQVPVEVLSRNLRKGRKSDF